MNHFRDKQVHVHSKAQNCLTYKQERLGGRKHSTDCLRVYGLSGTEAPSTRLTAGPVRSYHLWYTQVFPACDRFDVLKRWAFLLKILASTSPSQNTDNDPRCVTHNQKWNNLVYLNHSKLESTFYTQFEKSRDGTMSSTNKMSPVIFIIVFLFVRMRVATEQT